MTSTWISTLALAVFCTTAAYAEDSPQTATPPATTAPPTPTQTEQGPISPATTREPFNPWLMSASHPAETGVASWYGRSHRGRLTYSGDHFDPQAMTCAHRTLPMQTIIRVTTLKDGTSVICRVNDRGPFVLGRIVDLSEHAARQLGVTKSGIAPVRIEILRIGNNYRHVTRRWLI